MSLYNTDFGCDFVSRIIKEPHVGIHLIGARGAGMAPLGTLLSDMGARVTGYDRHLDSDMPKGVNKAKLCDTDNVDLAVYSLAISDDDGEIITAKERKIPLISRAELLGGVMLGYKRRIGVAGTHGKSTTTAILDIILESAGMLPTTVSGASLNCAEGYRIGGKETFLFEACEYKDSFLRTSPTDVIINNVELDHLDYFHSDAQLRNSFVKFAALAGGNVVIGDDGGIGTAIYDDIKDKALLVGSDDRCDFRYSDVEFCDTGTAFSLSFRGDSLGRFKIGLPCEYNVKNTTAALAMAYLVGADINKSKDAISSFSGIERRFEFLGRIGDRPVYYDYAHHPTEIRLFLSALKEKGREVTCIFRPHTFSRTLGLWNDFVSSLKIADHLILLDIYPAREDPIDGVTSEALSRAVGESAVTLDFEEVVNYCLHNTAGTIALLGAGDIEPLKKDFLSVMSK